MELKEQQIELMRTKMAAWGRYSRNAARLEACESEGFDLTLDEIILRLTTNVLTQTLEDKEAVVSFSAPSTWWQHWKQDCAPAWLTRSWPVQMTTVCKIVQYEVCAMYPKADMLLPELGLAVIHVLRKDEG